MSDEEVSHEPDRKSGGRLRRVAWMTGRVLVALASAAALASAGLARDRVETVRENVPTTDVLSEEVQKTAPPADDGADDYLVVGSDTRTDAQGHPLPASVLALLKTEASDGVNTDTIILLRVPKDGSKGFAISIPRDTYVQIPGYREDKINAAYGATKYRTAERLAAEGKTDRAEIERISDTEGRSALAQSVQNLTGVRVDHYAEVNLYGFYLITKAIGGVTVCLNHGTSDPNSGANFRKGVQTISGTSALAFVRQRDGLPRGDLDRIVRQQVFLGSAMQQMLTAGTLTDQTKLNALTDAASKSIVVSPGLDILTLVKHLSSMASGKIEFVTIPVVAVGARNERGQSIITVDLPKVKEFVAGLLGRQPPKFASKGPLLLNGTVAQQQPATVDGVRCVD
ncbi:LCP family protein required for cell wall assembly [Kibdelosporangium banguiense]|uniref:LCP family protein required for cell wall assembly n=1 Tax=Kibdelosporangium banguiense TaxID=1365924 RepID=A0ABS4TEJ5_9PSEU|nr:LCP family protein [Kibdelosporangium banguiense]MBP2322828.1 LCP family protein required for cell wall assembly [Kibdelosporangium banguiense]